MPCNLLERSLSIPATVTSISNNDEVARVGQMVATRVLKDFIGKGAS